MRPSRWKLLCALFLFGTALFFSRRAELIESVELKTLDWRFKRLPGAPPKDSGIVLLMLDQQSLDFFEKDGIYWPWPRSLYAAILDFCKAAGAKTVAFDVLFTSPSPYGVSEDKAFAKSLKDFGNAVLALETGRGDPKLPVPLLRNAAKALGDTSTKPDLDGVFRRIPLSFTGAEASYPTLAATVVVAAGGEDKLAAAPLSEDRFQIRFHGARPFRSYPLGRAIQSWQAISEKQTPSLGLEALKDKIVLIGFSAPGLMDLRPSPVAPVSPGTEIIAAAVDNILNGDFLTRGSSWWTALLLLAGLAGGAFAALYLKEAWISGGTITVLSLGLGLTACFAFAQGIWLDIIVPQLALWISFAASSAYGYAVEGKQKRHIQKAFSQYLAPEVVFDIAENPEKLALGGVRSELTCYFSDIEGFTTISEGLPPERLTYLMNRYLGEMTDTILASQGTLDKYIGDAIMAFWGAPMPRPDHALVACKAALANQHKLIALRKALEAEGFPPVRARIGLNTGMASVGNMGSALRFSYTAMGDDINLASRLEGSNKTYGTYLMISHSTREQAGDAIEVRELDLLKVKGKNKAVRVYELLGLKGETPIETITAARAFEKALERYRARAFGEALGKFKALLPDAPAELYMERCEHFLKDPPPPDWDGSYASKEK